MLLEMLRDYKLFQDLPYEEKEIFAVMANKFVEKSEYIYMSPDELAEATQIGTRHLWNRFLMMEPVNSYINVEIAQATRIAARKGIQNLHRSTATGEVQATKFASELAGFLDRDNNKVIILHHVDRPELHQPSPEPSPENSQTQQEAH